MRIALAKTSAPALDVAKLLGDENESLRATRARMQGEAVETEERCIQLAGGFDGKKTAILGSARETRSEAAVMMEAYLGGEDEALDGFEFLSMAEAGEVGHWSVVGKLNERAGNPAVGERVEWALPIQRRRFDDVSPGRSSSRPRKTRTRPPVDR